MAPMGREMDHLALGVHTSVGAPRSDNPRSVLGHFKQCPLDLTLDGWTAALYLKAKVLCAVIL